MKEPFVAMTANLAAAKGYGFDARKDSIREQLGRAAADVAGLQEVGADVWRRIGTEEYSFVPGAHAFWRVGGAPTEKVFLAPVAFRRSRFELFDSGTVWLTRDRNAGTGWDAVSPRALTWIRLYDKRRKRSLLHVNTHFDTVGVEARLEGVKILVDTVDRLQDAAGPIPVVVTGDMNMSPSSPHARWRDPELRRPYDLLTTRFRDAWQGPRPRTYFGWNAPAFPMDEFGTWDTDMIFVQKLRTIRSYLIDEAEPDRPASDHKWMCAELV